jgi:rhodanese-related sulfurtransferase
MDGKPTPISPSDLYARLGTAQAPIVIDVGPAIPGAGDRLIVSACYRPPGNAKQWSEQFLGRSVVLYCREGHEVSQGVAWALKAAGIESSYLDGGFAGWTRKGLPTRRNIGKTPGKWITRERPKIDRIACPWLIRRFIDPSAEFIYVPEKDVLLMAKEIGATPYDIKVEGVEFTHEGERCSFDTILRIYDIRGTI